jgi:hypothetical protein
MDISICTLATSYRETHQRTYSTGDDNDNDNDDDTPEEPAGTVLECMGPVGSRSVVSPP